MKIGILTYQNTLNFGAALQCYALYRTSTELGNETEVINYINSNIEATRNPINILRKDNNVSLKMTIASSFRKYLYNKKIKSFDNFNNKFIKLSDIRYISNDEINDNPPLYDKYIIGSDQVWNHHINGMDKTYFMDFVKNKSKIFTYASSFGLTKIDEQYKSTYKKYLNELHYISVRENEGARLINELVDKKVEIVNDPVFLISKDDWVKLIDTKVSFIHTINMMIPDLVTSNNVFIV